MFNGELLCLFLVSYFCSCTLLGLAAWFKGQNDPYLYVGACHLAPMHQVMGSLPACHSLTSWITVVKPQSLPEPPQVALSSRT